MNGCIFIETRERTGLSEIFERHLQYVPDLYPMAVCSKFNEHQFKDYDKIIIDHPANISVYNYMLTSCNFWGKIPFDKVLICEHDSGILREGIEEFEQWDYVGAPWWFQSWGGNGGFSWRSVEVMKTICQVVKYNPSMGQEDLFFCNEMQKSDQFKMAPHLVCSKFSVETVFNMGTFGYHFGGDAKRLLSKNQISKIKNQYAKV